MSEEAKAWLQAAPDIQAAGPAPGEPALRRAYLDLLKLALCDLVGTQTTSVGALDREQAFARELSGDGRRLRAAGMDWPLHGLTMVGLRRLDDLQACVEQVVNDGIEGDLIEAGAWRGGASMLMRATLDALGDDRTVVVADSFQGFPASDGDDPTGHELLTAPLEDVQAAFARLGLANNVEFVPGFFEQTLAGLTGRSWAIVRLDADTYDATLLALRVLYPGLAPGGFLVVDDYGSWEACQKAVDAFRAEHQIEEPLEQIDHTGWRWRRVSDAPLDVGPVEPGPPVTPQTVASGELRVPTWEELELRKEVAELREQLAAPRKRWRR